MPTTTLLLTGLQNDAILAQGAMAQQGLAAQATAIDLLGKASLAAAAARARGALVIYARLAFRPGHPEIGAGASPSFQRMKATNLLVEGTWGADTPAEVAPEEGDIVLVKRRVSCFAGTDLDLILRANAVTELVLLGGATNFVVEGTARDAVDRGFKVTVLSDACAAFTREAHDASMLAMSSFVTPRTSAEFIEALAATA